MNKFNKKIIIVALVLAVLASISGYIFLDNLEEPVTQAVGSPIIVAAADIPEKTLITSSMIKTINVEYDPELRNIINKEEDIIGNFTKEQIFKNDFFNDRKLVADPALDINLDLPKDHRAMSLELSAENAVSNLIYPGDHIDLILNISVEKEDTENSTEQISTEEISKFLLQNMYVLAINMHVAEESKVIAENESQSLNSLNITLAVPVEEVERLSLAKKVGRLEAVLRAHGDDAIFESNQVSTEDLENYSEKQQRATFENGKYYITEEGDTLKKISKKFYGDEKLYLVLKYENQILEEDYIEAGTKMRIPKQ